MPLHRRGILIVGTANARAALMGFFVHYIQKHTLIFEIDKSCPIRYDIDVNLFRKRLQKRKGERK